jgi:hypothetical protein
MPSPAFDVFRPHVDRTRPEHHFWHLRTPDDGETDIYADVTPGTFDSLTMSPTDRADLVPVIINGPRHSPATMNAFAPS